MTTAILGTGLEGLLAAHACTISGEPFSLLGQMFIPDQWCGYSPMQIPATCHGSEPDGVIRLTDWGVGHQYQAKAFGQIDPGYMREWQRNASQVAAWDMEPVFAWLKDRYAWTIQQMHINPIEVAGLIESGSFERVLTTVAAPSICQTRMGLTEEDPCRFAQMVIKTAPVSMVHGVGSTQHQIVRDGTVDHSWYRTIHVFNQKRTEWASHLKPPIEGVETAVVPLRSNCRCLPEVVRLSRDAMWQRGVAPWSAFVQAMESFQTEPTTTEGE